MNNTGNEIREKSHLVATIWMCFSGAVDFQIVFELRTREGNGAERNGTFRVRRHDGSERHGAGKCRVTGNQ